MGENDLEGFITPLSTNGMDTSLQAEERLHLRIFRKSTQYMENSVLRVCDYFIDMRIRVIKLSAYFLHANPPSHPELSNLLSFIHKPHIQQQLRSTSNRTLQRAENPSVRITSMFTHKHRMLFRLEVRRKI